MTHALNSSPPHLRITDWPVDERPREKLVARGAHGLTDAELLAILLRTGAGRQTALDLARGLLLQQGSLRAIARANPSELTRHAGIGEAKAVQLLAAFEIGRRANAEPADGKHAIRTPDDAARLLVPLLGDRPNEVFHVLVLDAANAVKANVEITRGTLNASLVHPREVFKVAIDHGAASVIVAHNHPSGTTEPSPEDCRITRQLREAGDLLGIPLHDHLIVGGTTFTSMAEKGLL